MMLKSLATEADAVIFDLEDSVPPDQKESAREEVVNLLSNNQAKKIFVRINALDTPYVLQDIIIVSRYPLKGIVVPKVSHPSDVVKLSWLLDRCSPNFSSDLQVIPIVETAQGIVNIQKIAAADSKLRGIMFGALDYVLDMKGNAEDEMSLITPRSLISIACRANNIYPIDSVYPNYKDMEGLERECRRVRAMGFAGKACIHPSQIKIINQVFSHSAEEIAKAELIVEAYDKAALEGKGDQY